MRRIVAVLLPAILLLTGISLWATGLRAVEPDGPIVISDPPSDWIGPEIRVTDLTPMPRAPMAGPASDNCSEAPPLTLSFESTADGGATLTNGFTQVPTDPILGCMFNMGTNPRGFRTAWYSLTAGDTSAVTITTAGTQYDTVLGVYGGSCENLQQIACSDDVNGFQSSVTLQVIRNRTYYVLVADYKPGVPEAATLILSSVMFPGGARWQQINNSPLGGISRHAFANDGVDMYLIGGQTRIAGVPVISNSLLRYNVELNQWTQLADVPGSSLSNTTAVRLGRRIYVPGGFNGNTTDYVNVHLVYDLDTDFWFQSVPVPDSLLPNEKMFAWSSAAADPTETSYFVTGGLTSFPPIDPDAVVLNTVFRFFPGSGVWQSLRPMSIARYAHTAAWVSRGNRGLCVAGGLSTGVDGEGDPVVVLLTGGECLDPQTGSTWTATGPLNFPRYNAGSAIGPDGNWYIFGGLDAEGAVPETEVYDPVTNTWRVLGGEYSLGGSPDNPARSWPRGAFWGNQLYVFGGNTAPETRVISSVERMSLAAGEMPEANHILVPMASVLGGENFLANGAPLALNQPVSGNFVLSNQFYNAYYFDWPVFGRATLTLGNIPNNTNFNITLYDGIKVQRAQGNPALYGGPKVISATLAPDRYYVVVERIFPKDLPNPNTFYSLVLTSGQ